MRVSRLLVTVFVVLAGSACGVGRHDLQVTNAWDRGVEVQLASSRGSTEQFQPLGAVPAGATVTFVA